MTILTTFFCQSVFWAHHSTETYKGYIDLNVDLGKISALILLDLHAAFRYYCLEWYVLTSGCIKRGTFCYFVILPQFETNSLTMWGPSNLDCCGPPVQTVHAPTRPHTRPV